MTTPSYNPFMDDLRRDLTDAGIKHRQRTYWHVQVPTGNPEKFHNIWVNKSGVIRVQIDGQLQAKPLTKTEWNNLLERFKKLRLERQTKGEEDA